MVPHSCMLCLLSAEYAGSSGQDCFDHTVKNLPVLYHHLDWSLFAGLAQAPIVAAGLSIWSSAPGGQGRNRTYRSFHLVSTHSDTYNLIS